MKTNSFADLLKAGGSSAEITMLQLPRVLGSKERAWRFFFLFGCNSFLSMSTLSFSVWVWSWSIGKFEFRIEITTGELQRVYNFRGGDYSYRKMIGNYKISVQGKFKSLIVNQYLYFEGRNVWQEGTDYLPFQVQTIMPDMDAKNFRQIIWQNFQEGLKRGYKLCEFINN